MIAQHLHERSSKSAARHVKTLWLLVAISGCSASFNPCLAGGFDGDFQPPDISGQSPIQASEDPILMQKDPYAALIEQQDPYRHATRKALAIINAARKSDSAIATGNENSSLINKAKSLKAMHDSGTLNIGLPVIGDAQSSSGGIGDTSSSTDQNSSVSRRHDKKHGLSTIRGDDGDIVGVPNNPAASLSCAPPVCHSERSSWLSTLAPLSDR
jgi:hypothetical protein